jgi:DNA-directed RNA polymerase subunit RPC12/RpoP
VIPVSVVTYKCPNCGAALRFDGDEQKWKCDFCISSFDEAQVKVIEKEMPLKEETTFSSRARAYHCNSCGAEVITDDTTAATFCYYCHNSTIIPAQLSGNYAPAKVIPFKFDREKATEVFIKWCKKKPLLSSDYISSSQLKLLSGVYIPYWLFDCDVSGQITADARNVRIWTSGDKRYTETKYYYVSRSATARFDGIPADGSKKTDDRLMETLEPFDYSQLEDFSMSYLSGFLAERYDMDQNEVEGRVRRRIEDYTSKLLRDTIHGYNSVSVNSCNVGIHNEKATYVLLPIWMFTYHYKGKTYVFAMNGQTGKIAGSLPISKGRIAAWFSAISGSIFAILLIGGLLLS